MIDEAMQQRVIFRYLDMLRESGKTNMFGAIPYLVDSFKITKYDANRHLVKWMEAFGARHNPSGAHQECEVCGGNLYECDCEPLA